MEKVPSDANAWSIDCRENTLFVLIRRALVAVEGDRKGHTMTGIFNERSSYLVWVLEDQELQMPP